VRIVEVTHRYPPALGGVEIQVEAIARGLVGAGHSVEVITTDLARDRPLTRLDVLPPRGPLPVRRHRALPVLPAPHGLGLVAPGMALDLWKTRADVVHAHAFGMGPTRIAATLRRFRSTPLVVETHFDAGRGTSGWWLYARALARWTLGPADRVVAHTRLEAGLLASLGVDRHRIVQITNGIDLREFVGCPPDRPERPSATALFVGRLYPEQKGLEPLIRALAQVPRSLDVRLRIVGEDWGGRALVHALARQLGVEDRVVLTGALPRAEVVREFANADLFVLPSLFDCTPIVLVEAMAAGLPIVTTRVGGIPEVVVEGETALLCAPNDPAGLASAIATLAADPALRRRFGTKGRERVLAFSWDRIIPQWVALFETVGREASPSPPVRA
jgi:glycosyltransferase involved in cell wall biosynthesis